MKEQTRLILRNYFIVLPISILMFYFIMKLLGRTASVGEYLFVALLITAFFGYGLAGSLKKKK